MTTTLEILEKTNNLPTQVNREISKYLIPRLPKDLKDDIFYKYKVNLIRYLVFKTLEFRFMQDMELIQSRLFFYLYYKFFYIENVNDLNECSKQEFNYVFNLFHRRNNDILNKILNMKIDDHIMDSIQNCRLGEITFM